MTVHTEACFSGLLKDRGRGLRAVCTCEEEEGVATNAYPNAFDKQITALPELVEACMEAFEFFDNHGDGAPDDSGIGHESLRLAAQCRAALEKAGVKV